jgi:stalled ribosome rescue protein Dom34
VSDFESIKEGLKMTEQETMLQFQAMDALIGIEEVLNNPARERFMGWEQETKLKDAKKVLDQLIAELKKQDTYLKM